jgi:hypothetical protein
VVRGALLIRFDARQTEMLTRRAHLRGTSFSEEVGEAVDFYREMPVDTREERKEFAVEANCTADRIIQRLEQDNCAYGRCAPAR